jgi:hypothetical protein
VPDPQGSAGDRIDRARAQTTQLKGHAISVKPSGMEAGSIVVLIATLVVAVVLGFGLYSLFRGGDYSRTWSNKLMRVRIVAQLVAIVIILAVLWLTGRGPQ